MDSRLQEICPIPLQVVWHENKRAYLSARRERNLLHLRLHRLFLKAPTPVLEALIRFALKRDPQSRVIVKQMAHLYFSQNSLAPEPLQSRGKVRDLQEIFSRLNQDLQVERIAIGWAKRASIGSFRSITFGTYDQQCRQIRIHPILDDPEVPLYFLEFIVYHEMLHAICSSRIDAKGRCLVHTKEFREKERRFPRFREAKEWEKKSLTFFRRRKSHGRP